MKETLLTLILILGAVSCTDDDGDDLMDMDGQFIRQTEGYVNRILKRFTAK